jgi:hypothetical protein
MRNVHVRICTGSGGLGLRSREGSLIEFFVFFSLSKNGRVNGGASPGGTRHEINLIDWIDFSFRGKKTNKNLDGGF